MASIPQPPRPPVPPPPPRAGSHVVAIAFLVLAFIVLVSVMGIWIGFRIISRGVNIHMNDQGAGKKEVSIKTPFGGIEVNKEVSEAALGLPMYPGAPRSAGHGDASMNMNFGDKMARLVVAKFHTSDSLDKVKAFYEERLTEANGKFTVKDAPFDSDKWDEGEGNFIRKDREGKTVYEIKRAGSMKLVAIKDVGDGTSIDLIRITHGKEETN